VRIGTTVCCHQPTNTKSKKIVKTWIGIGDCHHASLHVLSLYHLPGMHNPQNRLRLARSDKGRFTVRHLKGMDFVGLCEHGGKKNQTGQAVLAVASFSQFNQCMARL
jgi:hypothetical protein